MRFRYECRQCGQKVVYRDNKRGYVHLGTVCTNGDQMCHDVKSVPTSNLKVVK